MNDKLSPLCTEFISQLASTAPVPGGGGAAALCAALSAALVSMAGELSLGKKSTAEYAAELTALKAAAKDKAGHFLALIDADADAFEPLSRAYSIPKDAPLTNPRHWDCQWLSPADGVIKDTQPASPAIPKKQNTARTRQNDPKIPVCIFVFSLNCSIMTPQYFLLIMIQQIQYRATCPHTSLAKGWAASCFPSRDRTMTTTPARRMV